MKHFPIYIYIGDDDKKIKSLVNELETTIPVDYEKELYFTEEAAITDLFASLNTPSLFGNGKVIKVYGFEKWLNELSSYFKNPDFNITLILISYLDPKEIEAKIKPHITKNIFLKMISAVKQSQEEIFEALSLAKVQLSPEARRYIMDNVNKSGEAADLAEILSAIPSREGGLTVEDIYPYIEGKENVFAFLDSLFSENFKQSLIHFEKLHAGGESMIGILVQISSRMRNIWNVKAYYQEMSEGDIAKKFGIHPFVVKKCLVDAKKLSFSKMMKLIPEIQKLDLALKSYEKMLQKICFEKLIYLFCM